MGIFESLGSEVEIAAKSLLAHWGKECRFADSSTAVWDLFVFFHSKITEIDYRRNQMSHEAPLDYYFLHNFRDRISADPRDQIFGKLGLLSNRGSTELGIEPDYLRDCRSLYSTTALKAMCHTRSLDMLWRPQEFHRGESVPTWVPDWSAKINSGTFLIEVSRFYMASFNAYAGWSFDLVEFDANKEHITLLGKMVDEIVDVSATFQFPEWLDWLFTKSILKDWKAMYSESAGYPAGGTYQEALYRLIAHDHIMIRRGQINDNPRWSVMHRRVRPGEWREIRRSVDKEDSFSTGLPMFLAEQMIFETIRGLLGLGPVGFQKGDTVDILCGGSHPLLLQPVHELGVNAFRFIRYGFV